MPRAVLDRAHWFVWRTYAEVSEEARDLAYALRIPIVFKRWDEGWVIWNYRNLDRHRWNEIAGNSAEADRRQEHHNSYSWRDDYSEDEYTRRDLEAESDGYARYAASYD